MFQKSRLSSSIGNHWVNLPFAGALFLAGVFAGETLAQEVRTSEASLIRINEIRCEGAKRTTCDDLIQILGISPRSSYSDDELNALNLKMRELGYYSSVETRLEPLAEEGSANLVLKVVEKPTGRIGVMGSLAVSQAHPMADLRGSFSDHNFLGKGYYLNVTVGANSFDLIRTTEAYGFPDLLQHYSAEFAAPLGGGYIGSVRALSLGDRAEKDLMVAGLGYQLDDRSFIMGYAGNAVGFNYTYASEDNAFIPTTGSLASAGIFGVKKLQGENNSDSSVAGNLIALEARRTWQLGHINEWQGALTLSLQFNNDLNPTFKSFEKPAANGVTPQNGITYAMVKTDGEGRRSSWFIGTNGIAWTPGSDSAPSQFYYRGVVGYKASLADMDVGLAVMISPEERL